MITSAKSPGNTESEHEVDSHTPATNLSAGRFELLPGCVPRCPRCLHPIDSAVHSAGSNPLNTWCAGDS